MSETRWPDWRRKLWPDYKRGRTAQHRQRVQEHLESLPWWCDPLVMRQIDQTTITRSSS